jgi:hypothetical protein
MATIISYTTRKEIVKRKLMGWDKASEQSLWLFLSP